MLPIEQKINERDLFSTFLGGIKKPSQIAVGLEWEKIGVHRSTGLAISYSGPRGVEAILQELISKNGWVPELQNGRPIALRKNKASITLEPGGQIELSGQAFKKLSENESEITSHLEEIRKVSQPLGIAWLGIGAQPVSRAPEIEWVPKERYVVMRKLLGNQNNLTPSMMKETASIQISIDYLSESDAMEKLAMALRLTPYLTALLANSPFENGQKSPYLSRRSWIWSKTAPERTGLIQAVLGEGTRFSSYVEFALDVPMLFVQRKGSWIAVHNRTFRQFLKEGYEGLEATPGDWELHLTGIFTEARLKNYIEIRSIDCQQTDVGLAAAALIKGLFYNASSRKKARALLGRSNATEIALATSEARQKGLEALIHGERALDILSEFVRLSREGLSELSQNTETHYLEPIQKILAERQTPAEKLLGCICCSPSDTVGKIINCAQI